LICKLSELLGILPYYYNYKGEKIDASLETCEEIIYSLGVDINEEALLYEIENLENSVFKKFLEPVYVIQEKNEKIHIFHNGDLPLTGTLIITPYEELGSTGDKRTLNFSLDHSHIIERKLIENSIYSKLSLPLPNLTHGYYKISLILDERKFESIIIVHPSECYNTKSRNWGIHMNIWSLRNNGYEGDFSHLRRICRYAKKKHGFVSIHPVHFNDPTDPFGISPYSALSRQFKTPLYLSIERVKEKNTDLFLYPKVWTKKMAKLKRRFQKRRKDEFLKFKKYRESLSSIFREDLKKFAVFCFLREKMGKDWLTWKNDLKNADNCAIDKIYRENLEEVLFYEYLQWLIECDLSKLKKYPICFDLGFGSIKPSFDVWRHQEVYALGCECGAPPDDFNPQGQKWGFPPMIPHKLRKDGYIPLIKLLRANMKGSILRFDHALGIFRTFWIPSGKSPKEGVYVKYPWEEILGVICLESLLNKTELVGEDLGTAENWMRDELMKRKINSWRVFYFEKRDSQFKNIEEYPENALTSITTHDLPTLKGYWKGLDLELRKKFSLIDEDTYIKGFEERQRDKREILNLLANYGLKEKENLSDILISLINFLSRTKSKFFLIYPEDILLIEDQTNLPGTTTEHPNWQKKLPVRLKDFLKNPLLTKIINIFAETGRIPH